MCKQWLACRRELLIAAQQSEPCSLSIHHCIQALHIKLHILTGADVLILIAVASRGPTATVQEAAHHSRCPGHQGTSSAYCSLSVALA